MIRKATLNDAANIQRLISYHAEKGQMLFRMLEDIRAHIADFFVCEQNGTIVGTCGVNSSWGRIVEVRSLAVDPRHFGRGVATQLVRACLHSARRAGAGKIFVLTYAAPLFEKLGFRVVDKNTLPEKIWADCQGCHKRDNCDEIAMARSLKPVDNEVSVISAPGGEGPAASAAAH